MRSIVISEQMVNLLVEGGEPKLFLLEFGSLLQHMVQESPHSK
jgi:hypothetical protein